ncbi:MAG: hypothetical protein VR66_12885 [Peptococcaceae bacterium BRH_c23]|nr:MAG: hypothetical protein VR66_12885 [Peptococcaceae bacterium BRH_c23]KJS88926.1 MAG: hypothetical protein JL57_10095 [Desulfosporosinus sp. BICA1-9]HBW36036.1 hypothetical protein [Desulfosporosinus sp.]
MELVADISRETAMQFGHNGYNRVDLTNTLETCGFFNVHSNICYEKVKTTKQGKRSFPIFFMIGQKRK